MIDVRRARTGLAQVAIGWVVEMLDFRINGYDLIPDLAGTGLVIAGLVAIAGAAGDREDPKFRQPIDAAIALAWVVAGFAVLDLFRVTVSTFAQVVSYLASFGVTLLTLTAVLRLAELAGNTDVARRLRTSRGLVGLSLVLVMLASIAGSGADEVDVEPAVVIVFVLFVIGAVLGASVAVFRARAMYP